MLELKRTLILRFYNFGAVSMLGISSVGLMTLPLVLSDYRQRKILKRYKMIPISPMTLLLSHVLFYLSLSIVSTTLVYLHFSSHV